MCPVWLFPASCWGFHCCQVSLQWMRKGLAARIFHQWSLGIRWERRWRGWGFVTFFLLSCFQWSPHLLRQLCLVSLSPELHWLHGPNLIRTLKPLLEILKLLITSHTPYLSKIQIRDARGDSHFFKFSRWFQNAASWGNQWILLWSEPSRHLRPPLPPSPSLPLSPPPPHQLPRCLLTERAALSRSMRPARCVCLRCSSLGGLRGSLLLSASCSPARSTAPSLPHCHLPQSSYHRSTGLCLPHKADAAWGQALAVLPWRFLGIQDWAWHRVVAYCPSVEHISLEKFSCWPGRESWFHVCVMLGRSSGETSRSQMFSARLSLCSPASARVSQTLVPPFLSLSSELLFWGSHGWAARSVAFPHLAAATSLSLGLTVI